MAFDLTRKGQLYLGVDGGGSKCRATLYNHKLEVLGTGVAGRANPLFGLEQTFDSILASTKLALTEAGLTAADCQSLVVGMGLAGVNVPRLLADVEAWQHPFQAMYVTSDLHTACIGAHGGGDGAVIITGTGSCGYVHVGSKSLCLGGHGFALGDKGSGAWIGLKAAEHALLHLDGFAEPTCITERLLELLGVTDALGIVENLAGQSSSAYAKLAREVLLAADDGDKVAQAILQEGGGYISAMARKLFTLNPPRFSMIGGLSEPLVKWLDADVVARLEPTLAAPEMGAVLFGIQQHAKLAVA